MLLGTFRYDRFAARAIGCRRDRHIEVGDEFT
jgi:hypothetical protein